MKVIVAMLTGIMLMLTGIFLLLISVQGVALFFAVAGVIAFILGAVEGVYGGIKSGHTSTTYARIAQTTCPNCGEKHDVDDPKCPYCDHDANEDQ